jgi:hypothetical protein
MASRLPRAANLKLDDYPVRAPARLLQAVRGVKTLEKGDL